MEMTDDDKLGPLDVTDDPARFRVPQDYPPLSPEEQLAALKRLAAKAAWHEAEAASLRSRIARVLAPMPDDGLDDESWEAFWHAMDKDD